MAKAKRWREGEAGSTEVGQLEAARGGEMSGKPAQSRQAGCVQSVGESASEHAHLMVRGAMLDAPVSS